MSIIPSAAAGEPRPVAVPIPDRVAALIGSCMPIHILQAEVDAECAKREALRFRAPLGAAQFDAEDRQDFEGELSRLARANKVLAAYDPRLMVRAGGAR